MWISLETPIPPSIIKVPVEGDVELVVSVILVIDEIFNILTVWK